MNRRTSRRGARYLSRLIVVAVALFGAVCAGFTTPVGAAAIPSPELQAYAYDGHHAAARPAPARSERGPPATTYGCIAFRSAVGASSGRPSARPYPSTAWVYTTYDHTGRSAQRNSGSSTTQTASGGRVADVRVVPGVRCAAKALTPLEQGAAKVPAEWGPGLANRDLGGTRWFDPAAPKANGIRIDEGVPNSSFPSQQVDHVIVRSGGRILGPDGKPIVGSLKQNPDAHIPLSDWLNWSSWNAP